MTEHKVDKYAVQAVKTNKDGLLQPKCCENGILPKLASGFLLVGRTGSGKTLCMISMLTNPCLLKGYFQKIILFVGVKPDSEMIESLNLKKSDIKEDFTEDDVKTAWEKCENDVKTNGMKKSKRTLFIFDDILGNPKFMRSGTMRKISTANRHANVSYMILSQYYRGVTPIIRQNVAYIIYFPASELENQKLTDEQCPPHMNKRDFLDVVKFATSEKYSFLSINTRAPAREQLRKNFNEFIVIN